MPARWARRILLAIGLLILIAGLAGWGLRNTVARHVLAGWCAERNLTCSSRFDSLGLSGAVIEDLSVTGQGRKAFEAARVHVRLDWPGVFSPRVQAVELDAPVVRGALSDGQIGFYGLERLVPSGGGGGGSAALPALDIRDGRILIGTSAGDVRANFTVNGQFPQNGQASLVLEPASLDEPQGYVRWSGGVAELTARDGQLEGRVNVTLEALRTDDVNLTDAELVASLEAGATDDAPAQLVWDGRIEEATGKEFELAALQTSGHAKLHRLEEVSIDGVLDALTEADMQLDAGKVHWAAYAAESARLEASLRKSDDVFAGPLEVSLLSATVPQGRADQVSAAGDVSWSKADGLRFAGPVATTGTALSKETAEPLLSRVKLPAPLTAHGDSLRASFRRALSAFDAETNVTASLSENGLAFDAQDTALLASKSGLKLTVSQRTDAPWFSLHHGQASITGRLSLQGGGAPDLVTDLNALTFGPDGLLLSAQSVELSPWSVNGTQFGMDLDALQVRSRPEDLHVTAGGAVTLSGPVLGLTLDHSRLTGAVQVSNKETGLRVEPINAPCLTFDTQGLTLGGVVFQPNRLNLCPRGGVFMKPGAGDASGRASLGNVSWPFQSKSVTGVLNLSDAAVDWSVSKQFSLSLSSPDIGLPMDIGDRTLSIDGASPRVRLVTAKGKTPALSATLGSTVFGGTLIPAKVTAGEIRFDGEIGSGGLSGDLAGSSVLIRDFRDDPVYQPLLADLTAEMHEWQLALSGPLRLQANDVGVGEITADINVLTLDGTARVATRPLEFRKGGLQPVMLSELLRGVYTDASGRMAAVSDVVIDGGRLAGTADVSVSDFGFQTTRLGRVENVNGSVHFDDLFTLSTAPTQVLTIGGMNPGVPLRDGRIVFALSGGKVLVVESAAFPFAGGTLALSPFDWTLGADTQHVEVTADAIDLAELVRILKLPKIEAEGSVSGRFPIDVERSKVLIRDARLLADDGGGRVAYLGNAADSAAQADANVRLAFEALKDFDFTVLEVGLDGDVADRVKITLKLAGKSRNDITYGQNAHILKGQPFEFNIAVDSALAELFRSSQFYTNQQKLTDFVVEEVLTDRGLKVSEDE